MNINLTPILQAILSLAAALITYRLIPWIKARTTEQQQVLLQSMVRTLVFAAEQLYGAGHGDEKLDYVCQQLKEKGYDVDRAEIEAAVYSLFIINGNTTSASDKPMIEGACEDSPDADPAPDTTED